MIFENTASVDVGFLGHKHFIPGMDLHNHVHALFYILHVYLHLFWCSTEHYRY